MASAFPSLAPLAPVSTTFTLGSVPGPQGGGSFADLITAPLEAAMQSGRHSDSAMNHYLHDKISVTDVADAVHRAHADWSALQKISEKTIQCVNDLLFKTGI